MQATVQLWQEHENILSQINNFLEQTVPALGSRLRLSNMNGINQEIAAKNTSKDQVDHAVKGMELALANIEQLEPRASKEGIKRLKEEHEDINGKLHEVLILFNHLFSVRFKRADLGPADLDQ